MNRWGTGRATAIGKKSEGHATFVVKPRTVFLEMSIPVGAQNELNKVNEIQNIQILYKPYIDYYTDDEPGPDDDQPTVIYFENCI